MTLLKKFTYTDLLEHSPVPLHVNVAIPSTVGVVCWLNYDCKGFGKDVLSVPDRYTAQPQVSRRISIAAKGDESQ